MNVGELIDILSKVPRDMPVRGLYDTCCVDEIGAVFVLAPYGTRTEDVVAIEVGPCSHEVEDVAVKAMLWYAP